MGFSFSRIGRTLTSKRFRAFYRKLHTDLPVIADFPDYEELIRFFHDASRDIQTKNVILHKLIGLYRQSGIYRELAPLFIALFTPALTRTYNYGRRVCPSMEREDIIQDILNIFLDEVASGDVDACKTTGRLISRVRNRFRNLVNLKLKENAEVDHGADLCELADDDNLSLTEDADTFLESLVDGGVITKEDRDLITATAMGDIRIKNITQNRQDYERLKKRRQRIFAQIRKYLLNALD
jgi:hypothetical protein